MQAVILRQNNTNTKSAIMEQDNKYCYKYPHPAVTADCVVFGYDVKEGLSLLLIERGLEPYKGRWAFPGGFMRIDESTDQCAERELGEETGLTSCYLEQFGSFSDVYRDPRERVVTIAYFALVKKSEVQGGDDARCARWFSIDKVPPLGIRPRPHTECSATQAQGKNTLRAHRL